MRLVKKISTLSVLLAVNISLHAQDLHFSQFFNSPLLTNPANTGFIPDADYRVGVNYRNQWANILNVPYKTMSAWADAQFFRDRLETGWLGLGALILSDKAGSGGLRSDKFYGSVAYHQMLGLSSLLSAGFNVGYASKRIDPSVLKFPDQFNGKFFDGTISPGVIFSSTSSSYFDMQAGVNYAYFPQENVYINAGYSVMHVNKPKESFFDDNTDAGKIPVRHTGFLNAILKVNPRVIINPNVYFTTQAGAMALNGGIKANYALSEYGEAQLVFGVYYRQGDAAIPIAGLEVKNLALTFSYDATVSSLKNFNNYRGAMEFSLIKKGFYSDHSDRQSLCPKF